MTDANAAEYIGGHGSVPPPQTVSKNGPKERRKSDLDDLMPGDIEEDEKEYIEGHGSVPPPQTVSKSGPRRRAGDDILDDDVSSDEDTAPWYHHARKGMIRLVAGGDSKHTFTMGQLVRCKFKQDEVWVNGFVTCVEPLQVGGSIWDQVEPVEEEGTGVLSGLFGGMLSGLSGSPAEGEDAEKKPWYNSFKLDGLLSLFGEEEPTKSPRHHFNEGDTLRVLQPHREQQKGATEQAASSPDQSQSASAQPSSSSQAVPGSLADDSRIGSSPDETLLASSASKLGSMLGIVQQQQSATNKNVCLLPSCVKSADYVSTTRVSFDAVYLRQHAFEIDGSGSLPSSGLAFGLDWPIESDTSVMIDEFEEHRGESRVDRQVFMMEGFIPPKERSAFALAKGATPEKVQQAELATFKMNRKRRASLAYLDEEEL